MKTLHLTLKKKWFDMIASGEKKEEYREIKSFWAVRLANAHVGLIGGDFMDKHKVIAWTFKQFDTVRFTNGYARHSPKIEVECLGISIAIGIEEWGAKPNKEYFVIKLGEIIKP
jgi:hypothetical protein